MNLSKDNATEGVSGGLEGHREPDRTDSHQSLQRFAAWLRLQSLPRFLGVLLGNTHDLETRLRDKDAEIERLTQELAWMKQQYVALTDSYLLSRGNKPTTEARIAPTVEQRQKLMPGENLIAEVEADKLAEMLIFNPQEMQERVEDLTRSTRPRDKEILRLLDRKLAAMPLNDLPTDGVVIGN